MTEAETESALAQARRDNRIAVSETIGCALATLRRLDHIWCDEDIREVITQMSETLSATQTKVKERIDG